MATTWYPVINDSICTACGTCVLKCSHGVYDAKRALTPVVVFPEFCIERCHGCGNRCPVGAITYFGDDTGWTPPKGVPIENEEACTCDGGRT